MKSRFMYTTNIEMKLHKYWLQREQNFYQIMNLYLLSFADIRSIISQDLKEDG